MWIHVCGQVVHAGRRCTLDRVQVILGHKTLAMTRRYAATRDEHVRAAIEQAFDEVAAY